jgi:hypothetical protein
MSAAGESRGRWGGGWGRSGRVFAKLVNVGVLVSSWMSQLLLQGSPSCKPQQTPSAFTSRRVELHRTYIPLIMFSSTLVASVPNGVTKEKANSPTSSLPRPTSAVVQPVGTMLGIPSSSGTKLRERRLAMPFTPCRVG